MFSRKSFRGAIVSSAAIVVAALSGGVTASQAATPPDPAALAPASSKAGYVATIDKGVLWLVSPAGVKTRVTAAPDSGMRLADVSNTGTRFLFTAQVNDEITRIATFDSGSGTWTSFTILTTTSDVLTARFTAPTGAAIWLTRQAYGDGNGWVERRSLAGAVQLRVPRATAIVPAADGLTFATDEGDGRLRIRANATGALVRTLPAVTGRRCTPVANWDATQLMATCWNTSTMRMDVYRFTRSGGAPAAVTRANAPFGFDGAWRTSRGIVASDAVQGTGDGLGFVPRPGSYTPIKAGFATWGMASVRTAIGATVYVAGTPTSDPNLIAMYAYDLATEKTHRLGGSNSVVVDPLR